MQGAKHPTETLASQAIVLFKYSVIFDYMKAPACNRKNMYISINYKENFESDGGSKIGDYFFLLGTRFYGGL